MKKVLHLNSTIQANEENITKGEFFGKEHIVIKNVGSMISDTVMNGVLYTDKAVRDLAANTTGVVHAPLSHPQNDDGDFILAGSPEAIGQNYIGAFAFNYRMEDDRLVHDIAIDETYAMTTEGGKEVMRRINEREAIDTSTGLLIYECSDERGYGSCGMAYNMIAHEMELDHDAILIYEQGAATNLQGVGFFTNAKGKVEVDQYSANASIANTYLDVVDIDFDEAKAIERIKKFTNSGDKPSSNYRRFFLEFDRDNVMDYDSYKLPFADIVNGKPVAVKDALVKAREMTEDPEVVEIVDAYLLKAKKESGMFGNAWNSIKKFVFGSNLKDNTIYDEFYSRLNSDESNVKYPIQIEDDFIIFKNSVGKTYKLCYNKTNGDIEFTGEPIELVAETNYNVKQENDEMKEMILEMLKKAGVETEGMTDEQILAAFKAMEEMPEEQPEVEAQEEMPEDEPEANAEEKPEDLKEMVKALIAEALAEMNAEPEAEAEPEANAEEAEPEVNAEEEDLAEQVEAMNLGINKAAAKAMGINAMKNVINSNTGVAFNAKGGYNGNQVGSQTWAMPE